MLYRIVNTGRCRVPRASALYAVLLALAGLHPLALLAAPEGASVTAATPAAAQVASTIGPANVAVVINSADPLSVAVGNYYVRKRHIPKANVITVQFDPDSDDIPVTQFANLRIDVESRVSKRVQAYALTWARPYRVSCMSITAAFAFGLDVRYCASGCQATRLSPYFNSPSDRPFTELHIRPAMSIAALDFAHAKALIDRGIRADGTAPRGTAYLLSTNDNARNVRSQEYRFPQVSTELSRAIDIQVLQAPALENRQDVMFYFLGAVSVPALDTNRFLPGAVADHLTSFGGMLTDSSQMSSLRWLEAGATGSYGTVVEPCNLPQKFPYIPVLMAHYLAGETLLEAYWKSVAMPGQGLFIGEPLAAPYRKR